MLLSEVLDKFLTYQYVSGSTDKTVYHYKQHIHFFIKFVGDIDINTITYDTYERYILYLRKKEKEFVYKTNKKEKLSSVTIRTYARALKTFLGYAYKNSYISINLYSMIKIPKAEAKTVNILNYEQIRRIINYYTPYTYLGSRNLFIVSLMLDCGLRLSEVVDLKLSDIKEFDMLILVNGKGQKQRLVPLSESTLNYFQEYRYRLSLKVSELPSEKFILNCSATSAVTPNSIKQIIKRLKFSLKIDNLHPHLLRHTFATMFLLNGGDPLHLQLILGHTTLTMTSKYVHIANAMNISKQSKYSPLSNLKK